MEKTASPTSSLKVFFCYSREDEELRDEVERHLSILKHKKVIESWHDRKIGAGAEWEGQIDHHLSSADIVILLVSAAFMSSGYCYDVEMKKALQRHASGEARVLPVIVRSVDWRGAPFEHLQILPRDAKPIMQWKDRDEALLDVARGIRESCSELTELRASRAGDSQGSGNDDLPSLATRIGELEGKIVALSGKVEILTSHVKALQRDYFSLRKDESAKAARSRTQRNQAAEGDDVRSSALGSMNPVADKSKPPTGVKVLKRGYTIAKVSTFDGATVTLQVRLYGVRLRKGSTERKIPESEVRTIVFARQLSRDENIISCTPSITLKDGRVIEYGEGETAAVFGGAASLAALDENGWDTQISTKQIRAVEYLR